jgi:hypothetical protein
MMVLVMILSFLTPADGQGGPDEGDADDLTLGWFSGAPRVYTAPSAAATAAVAHDGVRGRKPDKGAAGDSLSDSDEELLRGVKVQPAPAAAPAPTPATEPDAAAAPAAAANSTKTATGGAAKGRGKGKGRGVPADPTVDAFGNDI